MLLPKGFWIPGVAISDKDLFLAVSILPGVSLVPD
jgi:hypothetical protein